MRESEAEILVGSVDRALSAGLRLKRWWDERERLGDYADRFSLRRSFNPAGDSYGFFDVADLASDEVPVLGVVQEMKFDTPKLGPPERIRDQIREFVLAYLLRVSSFKQPDAYASARACMPYGGERIGFGYSQHYYKLFGELRPAAFPPECKHRIVDLRELSSRYEWILLNVNLYSFALQFQPFGPETPTLRFPLTESTYLVLTHDFVLDDNLKRAGIIGRYGLGYALVKNQQPRLLAYGPGEFDLGFQSFQFTVLANGESHVRMAFVANRPHHIFNLPIDPVFTFIYAANLMTGGLAARLYCVSRRELETTFLVQHYMQHYDMIVGALSTWSQVEDWSDKRTLPDWVVSGTVE